MNVIFTILVAGALTDNIVLNRLLGLPEASEEAGLLATLKRSGIVTLLMLISTAITYPVIHWVLEPIGVGCLSTLFCIIIICAILFSAFFASKKFSPTVYGILEANRSVLTCSSAVLGICLLSHQAEYIKSYPSALLYCIAAGLGFFVVSVILGSIHKRLKTAELPKALTGLPLTLLTASLLSLAFGGLA